MKFTYVKLTHTVIKLMYYKMYICKKDILGKNTW